MSPSPLEGTMVAPRKKQTVKKVTRVTVPMLNQMLTYCDLAKEAGCYYGNEHHFWRRHSKVVKWLEAIRDNRLRTGAK